MIKYIKSKGFPEYPELISSMFIDRKRQFRDRMNWSVRINDQGWEVDEYDEADPIYVVVVGNDGSHMASMRFLPTTGRHMTSEVFAYLLGDQKIVSDTVWECTRFCLSPGADSNTALELLIGALDLGLSIDATHSIGVFDAPMYRVYRALGWTPKIIGGDGQISVGIWHLSDNIRDKLVERYYRKVSFPANLFHGTKKGPMPPPFLLDLR